MGIRTVTRRSREQLTPTCLAGGDTSGSFPRGQGGGSGAAGCRGSAPRLRGAGLGKAAGPLAARERHSWGKLLWPGWANPGGAEAREPASRCGPGEGVDGPAVRRGEPPGP